MYAEKLKKQSEMEKMKRAKLLVAAVAYAASLGMVVHQGFNPHIVYAGSGSDTCTWTGGGDLTFNNAANWSNCGSAAPANGDALVFDNTALSDNVTINNDISSLSVSGITFTGTGTYRFILDGNELTVTGNISADQDAVIELSLTLGADVTLSSGTGSDGLRIGAFDGSNTLNLVGNDLTLSGAGATCGVVVYSALGGSGALNVNLPNGSLLLNTAAGTYTGAVTVTAGKLGLNNPTAVGATSGVTVSSGAGLALGLMNSDQTYTMPISLAGTGPSANYGALSAYSVINACAGGGVPEVKTATLTGAFTLTGDAKYAGDQHTKITGTYTANGHAISVLSGQSGTLQTPSGTVGAQAETVTVSSSDSQPSTAVTIGSNQTYVIDGVRGSVTLGSGGVLKGTGTVGSVTMSGGTLAPGHSPGILNSGSVVLSGGTYEAEIGGTAAGQYDQLNVTGTVQIDSGMVLSVSQWQNFVPSAGNTFTIINNDGSDAVTGTFNGLAQGATFTVSGIVYSISYTGGSGNDVVLTAQSVPSTPSTGFGAISANPIVTMISTLIATAIILVLSRRLHHSN